MSHEEVLAVIQQIDAETTRIGELLTKLQNDVKTGMSPAEVELVKTALGASAARLKSLGANPEEPIPEETPEFARAMRGR